MTAHQPAPAPDWRTAFPPAPEDALVQPGQPGVGSAAQGDINPEAWIAGFRNANGRLRQQAARSVTTQEKQDVNSMYQKPPASGFAIREGRLAVNPVMAEHILTNLNYARQRRTERGHIAALADEMLRGVWVQGTQIAFARLPDGALALVNGQHRLLAVRASNTTQEFQAVVLPVTTAAEVNELYYRFDTVQRKRSTVMVLNAVGAAEQHQVQREVARAAYEAGVIVACGLKRLQGALLPAQFKTPDGRLRALAPYWPQVKLFNDAVCVKGNDLRVKTALLTGSVMAVAILTFRSQVERATPFWAGIAANDGLKKGDPRRTLLMALIERDLRTSHGAIPWCVSAWNAWFDGRPLTYLRGSDDAKLRGVKIP